MPSHLTSPPTELQPSPTTRSRLFGIYNRARSARARTLGVERKRADRALGIALRGTIRLFADGTGIASGTYGERYYVTLGSCECKDTTYRGGICKHRIALMLLLRAGTSPGICTLDELILGRQCACALDDELVDLPGPWHERHCRNHAHTQPQRQPEPSADADLEAEIEALFGERDPWYTEVGK